jgi:nucleotide-binding universal stress UspA family protein
MIRWLKILCAIDFGESSRSALERSADLARSFGADLVLVHVWKGPRSVSERIARGTTALTPELTAEIGRKLEGWKAEAERIAGRTVRTLVTSGPPAAEVTRLAADEKVDLVVVGTHGRKGLERAVLGSVAEAIVRHAPCPVLVARPAPDWGD